MWVYFHRLKVWFIIMRYIPKINENDIARALSIACIHFSKITTYWNHSGIHFWLKVWMNSHSSAVNAQTSTLSHGYGIQCLKSSMFHFIYNILMRRNDFIVDFPLQEKLIFLNKCQIIGKFTFWSLIILHEKYFVKQTPHWCFQI